MVKRRESTLINRLQKAFDSLGYDKYQVGWYGNEVTPSSYAWVFEYGNKRYKLVCDKETLDVYLAQ